MLPNSSASVSAVPVDPNGLFALVEDKPFTDVPEFPAIIKAAPMALVPKASVDDFSASVVDLKAEVDQLRSASVKD